MLFSHCFSPYLMPLYSSPDNANIRIIRLLVFLITGVCAGFPALIWAFGVLYSHHNSGGRISAITGFLLLSDLLELILNPILAIYIFSGHYDAACMVFRLLFGARLCGHLLHQLVAVESILTQKYPSLAFIFSPPCSFSLCIIVWLVGIGYQFFPRQIIYEINICLCVLPVIACAVTCIVTCKTSSDNNQATDRKPGVLVLSVAMFTLIILYVPFFLTYFMELPLILDSLASMRLVAEPLLCVLICRENRLVQAADRSHTIN